MIKHLIFLKNPKHDGCQKNLDLTVYRPFDKKNAGAAVKNENMSNEELAEE